MQNNMEIFENPEFGKVRVIMQGEEPWFVAKDVAECLGYETPSRAIIQHCKKVNKITQVVETQNRPPLNINIIPESDVYRLIMRSNLPNAEKFQDWVCEEVLPSIRKHGAYATPEIIAQALQDPMSMVQLFTALAEEQRKNCVLEAEKAELLDTLGDGENFKSAKAIQWISEYFNTKKKGTWIAVGHALSKLSRQMGYDTRYVPSMEYGNVYGYSTIVIEEFKNILDKDGSILERYRR